MSANTSRLKMTKPGGGSTGAISPADIVDIDVLNGNFDLLDAAVGAQRVTSTTRPSQPFDGQIIYEADTQSLKIYSAGQNAWILGLFKREKVGATGTQIIKAATNPNTGGSGYQRVYYSVNGGMCTVQYTLYWQGSGNTPGSGSWFLDLPIPAQADGRLHLRGTYIRATGAAGNIDLVGYIDNNATQANLQSQAGTDITGATSSVGALQDRLLLEGMYPVGPATLV